MTSTSKQSEEHGLSRVDSAMQNGQAIEPLGSPMDAECDKALLHSELSAVHRPRGASRSSLSAGYIPIAASGPEQPVSSDVFDPLAQEQMVSETAPAPDDNAFELLERDLAELGSFLEAPGVDPDDEHQGAAPAVAPSVPTALSESAVFDAADQLTSAQPISHSSHEETSIMNVQVQHQREQASSDTTIVRDAVESAVTAYQSSAMETDGVLHDVQSTLDSLAGMAHGLSQQKLEIMKMREALEERRLTTVERERQLAEREDRLSQQELRLQEEKQGVERVAEQNAAVLAERSNALQALAETVDSRDRATTKRADVLNQEQQSIERQLNQMRSRAQDLDDREAGLQRQSAELADRFKQLLDAKERFGAIVKGFNETVRFNTTYSAISKSVGSAEEV
ncbi:hypothetical protein HNP46_003071 [Pseudomonas nitritireducens]|uniref:Uncharacterized protein n=1 Tax=Pseudomonas nitroreducens TaxID=46680 RepID=A0A7W7KJX7_PSENT|nr:hypothetical protein [Pseudomonas nitritireducens]MBB4864207.1 hypothetical protein [Pseudomonas nitritireducens]